MERVRDISGTRMIKLYLC